MPSPAPSPRSGASARLERTCEGLELNSAAAQWGEAQLRSVMKRRVAERWAANKGWLLPFLIWSLALALVLISIAAWIR